MFERTEPVKFNIEFDSKAEIKGLKFFLSISKKGKQSFGVSQTYDDSLNTTAGKHYCCTYSFDAGNFSPGVYLCALHAFSSDNVGNIISYDYPAESIRFTIVDLEHKGIKWDDRWFGPVMLNEIKRL